MTEEPYRWLEAINNRREYIEDQLAPGLPVVALSAEPGILLLTVKSSTPKLFEIYDHLALGCIGHPADIEKVRQTVIDAAHVDGFTRSPSDVTARRLVSYNLAPALKTAFEQIFAAPLLFRGVLAELGATPGTIFSGTSIMTARSARKPGRISPTASSAAAHARFSLIGWRKKSPWNVMT